MAPSAIDDLLERLALAPTDVGLRSQAAEALTRAGRHAEAAGLLAEGLINLTAHDGPTLPCLCRRCLQPGLGEAEAEGMKFVRRFALAKGRVLWYWAPIDLANDRGLARSIAARLEQRLAS